jgi:hypothetical protein
MCKATKEAKAELLRGTRVPVKHGFSFAVPLEYTGQQMKL